MLYPSEVFSCNSRTPLSLREQKGPYKQPHRGCQKVRTSGLGFWGRPQCPNYTSQSSSSDPCPGHGPDPSPHTQHIEFLVQVDLLSGDEGENTCLLWPGDKVRWVHMVWSCQVRPWSAILLFSAQKCPSAPPADNINPQGWGLTRLFWKKREVSDGRGGNLRKCTLFTPNIKEIYFIWPKYTLRKHLGPKQ